MSTWKCPGKGFDVRLQNGIPLFHFRRLKNLNFLKHVKSLIIISHLDSYSTFFLVDYKIHITTKNIWWLHHLNIVRLNLLFNKLNWIVYHENHWFPLDNPGRISKWCPIQVLVKSPIFLLAQIISVHNSQIISVLRQWKVVLEKHVVPCMKNSLKSRIIRQMSEESWIVDPLSIWNWWRDLFRTN